MARSGLRRATVGRRISGSRFDLQQPHFRKSARSGLTYTTYMGLSPWAFWSLDVGESSNYYVYKNHEGTTSRDLDVTSGQVLAPGRYGLGWLGDGDATGLFMRGTTFNSSAYTLACWINLTSLGGTRTISGMWQGSSFDKNFYVDSSGYLFLYYYNGSGRSTSTPASPLSAGTWYHVAASTGAAGGKVYVNGSLVGSNASPNSFAGYGGPNFYIGYAIGTGSGTMQGTVDEIGLWNSQLSDANVATLVV